MKAKRLYYLMLGAIVVTLIGGGAVFYFANGRLGKTIDTLAQQEENIQIATKEVANLQALQKQLEKIEAVKPEIDAALPKTKTQSEAISQLIEIGRANGMEFRSIQFEATEGLPAANTQTKPSLLVPAVSTIPVTLETNSIAYETLKSFLRDVLAIRRNANVNTLIITRNAENPGSIEARIVVDIHLEKVEAPLTEEEKAKRLKELEKQGKNQ